MKRLSKELNCLIFIGSTEMINAQRIVQLICATNPSAGDISARSPTTHSGVSTSHVSGAVADGWSTTAVGSDTHVQNLQVVSDRQCDKIFKQFATQFGDRMQVRAFSEVSLSHTQSMCPFATSRLRSKIFTDPAPRGVLERLDLHMDSGTVGSPALRDQNCSQCSTCLCAVELDCARDGHGAALA